MPGYHHSRGISNTYKEPLFIILLLCVATIFTIFILAAAKIARELHSRINVFWAILYTTALAILSLLYLTVFVAYYKPLSKHASTFTVNFSLGVAWAIALIAEVLDPNNTWPNELSKFTYPGHEGESVHNYRARVALSGITAGMLLVMSLVGGLRMLGIGGGGGGSNNGGQRQDWESQEGSIEMEEGRIPTPVESRREESSRQPQPQRQQGQRNTFMLVLARVGIIKDRSVVSERGV